jgi:RNA polymerase sigma factor (sigma-70 family)
MSDAQPPVVLRNLRRALGRAEAAGVSDAELLERFVAHRDESAFELLVWRHERLVSGVCRRVLGNVHDAEDAFQAAFLVLARKAASIGRGQALASWLYQVAVRIALRARAAAAARAGRERQGVDLSAIPATDEAAVEGRDLALVLDEEVGRLPEQYRGLVVLCCLEGRTYGQAARQLGCSLGTVSTRLTRAREILRGRLERRGVALGAAALAAVLGERAVSAALVQQTARAAALGAPDSAVSPAVAALTKGALNAMRMTKLKVAAALLLTVCLFGGGAALFPPRSEPPARAGGQVQKQAPTGKAEAADRARLQGTWVSVSINNEGKDAPAEVAATLELLFKGDRVTSKRLLDTQETTYRLNATRQPKTIELGEGERREVGIYEFAGDRLRVCMSRTEDRALPADFKAGEGRTLVVLKRGEPGKLTGPAKEARLALEVRALRDAVEQLKKNNANLLADLAQRAARFEEGIDLDGVLKKVDIAKNTISLTVGKTRLALDAVPLSNRTKFFLNLRECRIDDLKAGMEVLLKVQTRDERSEVVKIWAEKPRKE